MNFLTNFILKEKGKREVINLTNLKVCKICFFLIIDFWFGIVPQDSSSEEEEVDISKLNKKPPFSTVSILDSPKTRKRKEKAYKEKRRV